VADTGRSDSKEIEIVFEIDGIDIVKKVTRMVWRTAQADANTDVALLKLDSPLQGVTPLEFRDTPMFDELNKRRRTKDAFYGLRLIELWSGSTDF
jgi:hypothetical protein